MNYVFHLLIYCEIYAIVAMSLNLLIGYSGLLQVAHAAYYGIGAYAAMLLWVRPGWGFFPGLAVAALTASLLSLLVSLPAWRFKDDYFVMISIAVQTLLYTALYNWTEVTDGPFGISDISRPVLIDCSVASEPSPNTGARRHAGGSKGRPLVVALPLMARTGTPRAPSADQPIAFMGSTSVAAFKATAPHVIHCA